MSMQMILTPCKISQCATKRFYYHRDTLSLLSFRFLECLLTNGPANFFITCSYMLMIFFLLSYVYIVPICKIWGFVWIVLLNDSLVIWINYRLDMNLFLRKFYRFPNTLSGFKIQLEEKLPSLYLDSYFASALRVFSTSFY